MSNSVKYTLQEFIKMTGFDPREKSVTLKMLKSQIDKKSIQDWVSLCLFHKIIDRIPSSLKSWL